MLEDLMKQAGGVAESLDGTLGSLLGMLGK
jgi:hypothetical protein